jgi:mannosyltransferase
MVVSDMSGPRSRWRILFLTLAALLLAFALRIYRLSGQSLWYDEALSVHYADQPLQELLSGVSGSDHPPLHSLLLHLWMIVAGRSEFSVRYLSLWWGVLSVALLYCLGQKLFDKPTALLASALLAASPLHVWYSQEARMYSLALALSLGLVLALLAIVTRRETSTWPWVSYALAGALALYAHFYTSFILIFANLAFGEWWLVRAARKGWRAVRGLLIRWAMTQMGILSLFLPWGRFVAEQYATNATYWHGALGLGQILRDTALAFTAGERVQIPLAQAGTLALATLGLLGIQVAAQSSSNPARQGLLRGERALWLLLWLAVPGTVLFAISHNRPKFAPRYLLPALPALLLLAAGGSACLASLVCGTNFSRERQPKRGLAAVGLLLTGALVLGASVASLQAQYFDEALARPDFRAVANYVKSNVQPDDIIVLIGGHSYPAFAYYFDGELPVHPMPPGLLPSTREPLNYRAVEELTQIAAGRSRLWLVLWQYRLADPMEVILGHLLRSCPRLDVGRNFHDVALLLFSVADCTQGVQIGPSHPLRAEFGGQMRLLGYDLGITKATPSMTLYLTLYWEAIDKTVTNYTTLAQLLGPDGHIYGQHDRLTGDDAYPTSHWQQGIVVRNEHTLIVVPDAPPGNYELIVGLYVNEGTLPRLPVTFPGGATDDAVILREIKVGK